MTSPDILDIVPEHVADPVRRGSWPARIGTAVGDGMLSFLLNAAVVGWLAGIGWPRAPAAPASISVELVDHMPGTKAGTEPSPGDRSGGSVKSATKGDAAAAPASRPAPATVPDATAPPAQARPPAPAAAPPAPAAEQQAATATPPPAAVAAVATPPAAAPATPPAADDRKAVPPPPEHPNNIPQPHLVEAPAPPRPAETRADPAPKPVVAPTDTAQVQPAAGPPPATPKIVTSGSSDEVVPDVTPPPAKPPAQTAEQKRQADNTATLAAMLPFGANVAAEPFRTQTSAAGQALSDSYRGAVYGNFNKAADVIEAAKAQGLKGQTVVAFTVDDHGGLQNLAVAVSSGNPAVDQAALELIRRAAPFPPPPPGAQRSFSPAIGLGLDQ